MVHGQHPRLPLSFAATSDVPAVTRKFEVFYAYGKTRQYLPRPRLFLNLKQTRDAEIHLYSSLERKSGYPLNASSWLPVFLVLIL